MLFFSCYRLILCARTNTCTTLTSEDNLTSSLFCWVFYLFVAAPGVGLPLLASGQLETAIIYKCSDTKNLILSCLCFKMLMTFTSEPCFCVVFFWKAMRIWTITTKRLLFWKNYHLHSVSLGIDDCFFSAIVLEINDDNCLLEKLANRFFPTIALRERKKEREILSTLLWPDCSLFIIFSILFIRCHRPYITAAILLI